MTCTSFTTSQRTRSLTDNYEEQKANNNEIESEEYKCLCENYCILGRKNYDSFIGFF